MKVAIVGTGTVGSTYGFTLFLSGLATEIALVNRSRSKAVGDAIDLIHGLSGYSSARIYSSTLKAVRGADIIILTAGPAMKPGETRLDLIHKTKAILRSTIEEITTYNPACILILVTNPVDVLTYLAIQYSGLHPNRVIGSGTLLDSMRLRSLLADYYAVDPSDLDVFILGEHGDSMVPIWSLATIKGIPITSFPEYDEQEMRDIFRLAKTGAQIVKARKGATQYSVALAVQTIVAAIVQDKKAVLPVSSLVNGVYGIEDTCLSLPAVVGRNGVVRVLEPPLSERETKQLKRSASVLKKLQNDSMKDKK